MLVKLSDAKSQLPWPGVPGRILTGANPFDVDESHPFWLTCLNDGSVVEVAPSQIAAASITVEKK